MSALTSGRSIAGFRMSPRSPPVIVQTRTSAPSLTYLAIVAAPLLDSSSGCACTAISRSFPWSMGGSDPWDGNVDSLRLYSFPPTKHPLGLAAFPTGKAGPEAFGEAPRRKLGHLTSSQ